MVEFVVTDRKGATRTVDCLIDQSLMLGLKKNGFDILATCGGIASCSTCHVYLEPADYDRFPPPSEFELELLEEGDNYRSGSSRLSCQLRVADDLAGMAVTVAPED
ncbi:MAG TPA: 2Fe-2S iron-sulfur cluster-binding protein [Caulobacteraceae bacterium]|jgi:2Fe-2S ferredoxin|nr:2Fe-2S iron-sulfur cluster-binding protein [Caulobacteraceae bacterium]